jgi:hypothetical protein
MTKIAGSGSESGSESGAESGSGSISQRHGSADPDPGIRGSGSATLLSSFAKIFNFLIHRTLAALYEIWIRR